MTSSVVIIGGGLGGLFTGALLAKEGVKVTILEKNTTVGGGLQSFMRFGEIFDTGMHVIAGMRDGGNIRCICDYIGITDKIHLHDIGPETIDELYFAEDRKSYKISMGKIGFVEALTKDFPDEEDNLKKYVDAMFAIADELDMHHLRPSTDFITVHSDDFLLSADDFIAKYISDEKLRSVVAYMNPLYSGRKGKTPAYIHAIISVLYISGPSRFIGGSYRFAEVLKDSIISRGGTVLTNEPVSTVHTQDKLITSVSTESGKNFSADSYVCAIHPCTLFDLLDDKSALPKAYRTRLESLPNSYSAFILNIKLKPGTFRYIDHTAYYMSRYDNLWEFDSEEHTWPLGFMYMTPPDIDQGEYSSKMIITAPMTWSNVKKWEDSSLGHRPEDYKEWKMACKDMLISRMQEIYPSFLECIDSINTASPLTIRDYYGVKEGAMCGFSRDCNNMVASQVPVVTKIKNLFLTGQNCNIHGFCGVPLTAITTCEAILGRNYILNKINNV